MLVSLQLMMMGMSVFPPEFFRSRRKARSSMQLPDMLLSGDRNLSSPSKREEDPAHIRMAATA
jgi:hypothetical protein